MDRRPVGQRADNDEVGIDSAECRQLYALSVCLVVYCLVHAMNIQL
jgi:hypothetical protein